MCIPGLVGQVFLWQQYNSIRCIPREHHMRAHTTSCPGISMLDVILQKNSSGNAGTETKTSEEIGEQQEEIS